MYATGGGRWCGGSAGMGGRWRLQARPLVPITYRFITPDVKSKTMSIIIAKAKATPSMTAAALAASSYPVAQKTGIEMRIASRLGLQRRQRDVTPTVEEYLRSKRQELPS